MGMMNRQVDIYSYLPRYVLIFDIVPESFARRACAGFAQLGTSKAVYELQVFIDNHKVLVEFPSCSRREMEEWAIMIQIPLPNSALPTTAGISHDSFLHSPQGGYRYLIGLLV